MERHPERRALHGAPHHTCPDVLHHARQGLNPSGGLCCQDSGALAM